MTTPPLATARSAPADRTMKLVILAVGVLAVGAVLWPRGTVEREAPGGFLVDAGGRPTPLGTRLAPATLLHFWATWCPPCVTEIPALQRLDRDLGDPAFQVVMVAVADDPAKVRAFLGGRAEEALFDPRWEVAHRYGTRKLPESYLVVRGKVVEKFTGSTDWSSAEVRDGLARRLAASGLAAAGEAR
jgi:thiol-disulfide isomerase/thioredoxin